MARGRYYLRKRRPKYKLQRYSNETMVVGTDLTVPNAGGNPAAELREVIINTDVQGMRKVKNFTVQIMSPAPVPVQWALIYIPEGTANNVNGQGLPNNNNPVSLYEPNQNVIMSGILLNSNVPMIRRTRLARNLNSGDMIALTISAVHGNGNVPTVYAVYAQVNYAISF